MVGDPPTITVSNCYMAFSNLYGYYSHAEEIARQMVEAENRITHERFVRSLCRVVEREGLGSQREPSYHGRVVRRILFQPRWKRGRWKAKT